MTRRCFGSLRREESGQSLVVIVLAMGLIILIAAFAIDVSSWYTKHHQAQVTADSAALAAANYMSLGGSVGTATTVATTYASDNNLPVAASNVTVDTGAKTVTVIAPTTGPLEFAGIALNSPTSISARAVASWAIQDCESSGSGCAFAYAADNVCSGTTGVTGTGGTGQVNKTGAVGHGITINENGVGSGTPITGAVVSASNITTSVNKNDAYQSVAAYSNGTGCTGPDPSSPSPFTAAVQRAVASQFPIDYRLLYSTCPFTSTLFGAVTCDANGYPSYCTAAVENTTATINTETVNAVSTNAIYCDAGSGNKADPTTWNGTIDVTGGGNATFVAGTVNISGGPLGPASGNQLLAYGAECNDTSPSLPTTCPASGSTTLLPAVDISAGGNVAVTGDIFAPAGVIDSHFAGTPTLTGFLEGWDVVYNADGTVTAQGPPVTPTDIFYSDTLTQ